MGVFIPGMEMPKKCNECPMLHCLHDNMGYYPIPDDCPLIPVPPHGRLIDADALIKGHFSDEHRIAMSYANKCWMRRIINEEPTLIPAEEETP